MLAEQGVGVATVQPAKELKLTKPKTNGASQLNSSVGRTCSEAMEVECLTTRLFAT
jgi:hypothetical protein